MKVYPIRERLMVVLAGSVMLTLAILTRAVFVQIIGDSRLEQMAKRQFQSKVLIRPRRGLILDRNGEPLAVNFDAQSLAANPSKIENGKSLSRLLGRALGVPGSKFSAKIGDKTREFIWIKRHISEQDVANLKHWGVMDSRGDLMQGLWLIREAKRVYPHNELAGQIIGSVNLDGEGLEGAELWANTALTGKVISVSAVKDALGRPTFIDPIAAGQGAQDGSPVELTIDASLQFAVEQELKASVLKHAAKGGTVIVMNAVNGEVLAMASEPSFNPNDKSAPAWRRRSRSITDGFEPGSIMKPLLLAGALNHGMKISDQLYGELGNFTVQGKRINEAESHEKFGLITLKKMIQVSSNIGAAKLALKLGADRYYETLLNLGFGSKSEIGFPGEISGRVPPRKAWQPLTTANIGFGQGVLVTPIQMVRAYASILNGGFLVKPTLMRSQRKQHLKRVFSQKGTEGVIEALHSVTEDNGTGIKARVPGYHVAGKTGTAQVVDPNTGRYSRSRYIASFVGFATGIEPKYVILTMVDEPRGIYYASETAAPLFANVLQAVANRFSLPTQTPSPPEPKLSDRLQHSLAKVLPAKSGNPGPMVDEQVHLHRVGENGAIEWRMPQMTGLTAREAMQLLQGRKFFVELSGDGIVRTQNPEAGKIINEGATVKLLLSEP